MNITYENYPLLGFPRRVLASKSGRLPFQILGNKFPATQNASVKLQQMILGFMDLYRKGKGNTAKTYYISPKTHARIQSDVYFREEYFNRFFKETITTECGYILLPDNMIYLYVIISEDDVKKQFNIQGSYIAAACFDETNLTGFEDVFIREIGFELGDGMYSNTEDSGSLVYFCMVCLGLAREEHEIMTTRDIEEVVYSL